MTDEERSLACKRIENLFIKIMELRLENCELKWQVAKLKKSKKKHKFKFMIIHMAVVMEKLISSVCHIEKQMVHTY